MSIEQILFKCNMLVTNLDFYNDKTHNTTQCEWELGTKIIDQLIHTSGYSVIDDIKVLMGIPIRVNLVNPECIKLWREMK